MHRRRSSLLTALAALAATAIPLGAATAGGLLGPGHLRMGHHGVAVVGVPVQTVGLPLQGVGVTPLTSPLTGAGAGLVAPTSPLSGLSSAPLLSTASFGSTLAGAGLASGTVLYHTVGTVPAAATTLVTSPLSTAGLTSYSALTGAPAAAPVTSPLSGAGVASAPASAVSLAGVDTRSILDDYNRFANTERAGVLGMASVAGVSTTGVTVSAAELSVLATQHAGLAQTVGGVGNLHGFIRFLRERSKTGDQESFAKTARGLFGEVLGGALRQAPEVALNILGGSVDAMIRQFIPGFSLFSQPPTAKGNGNGIGTGTLGTSRSNPLFVQVVPEGKTPAPSPTPAVPPVPPTDTTSPFEPISPPSIGASTLLDFIKKNAKDLDLDSLQVAPDGTLKGKFKDGREIQPGAGLPPTPPGS